LEHAVDSGETFAKLFGVTSLADPSQVNLNYRYVISGVAEKLGVKHWTSVQKLIKELLEKTGFDMKASDNKYHIVMRTGQAEGSRTHKYSDAAVDLLQKVQTGAKYKLETKKVQVVDSAK
jgi:hypothetical protein